MKGESIALDRLVVGEEYSRDGIALAGSVTPPTGPRDPHWATGIVRFDNAVLLLVTLVKTETYRDYFDGPLFWWQSQTKQSQTSPVIRRLASGELPAHLFVRVHGKVRNKTQPFVYCGQLSAPEFEGEFPVTGLFEALSYSSNATGALKDVYAWRPDERATPNEEARHTSITKRRAVRGQGRQLDPELRRALELYAMRRATEHYEEAGYHVQDSSNNRPYDLVCTRHGDERRVEVKATQSSGESVLLTAGEVKAARDPVAVTDLFVLHGIVVSRGEAGYVLSGGTVKLIRDWTPREGDLTPTEYTYLLPID